MKIEQEKKLDFRDVLIRPRPSRLSSRQSVSLTRTFEFSNSSAKWSGFPLIASNMDTTGTIEMARALSKYGAVTALSKYYSPEKLIKFFRTQPSENSFYSMGITPAEFDQLKKLKDKISLPKISIEVANGYIPDLPKVIAAVRRECPQAIIMAGSVCTPEGTRNVLKAGADIARVGIGSGSVCITRKITGIGYPQLSAAIECAEAAHQEGGFICSDGGCTVPGDVCKAFGAGADFVMLGGMLAGHKECSGVIKYERKRGKKIPVSMQFYGMASDIAQQKHFGGKAAYRASEGKVVNVPYRGAVAQTILEIMGGLRSMMTYIDAADLSEVSANTHFVKVGAQLNTVFGK